MRSLGQGFNPDTKCKKEAGHHRLRKNSSDGGSTGIFARLGSSNRYARKRSEADGYVILKIPEGTQSGKQLRIRGKGVPFLNESGTGDLGVQVVVQVPRKLSRSQREMVAKLAESLAVENKPTSPSLIEKMIDPFN